MDAYCPIVNPFNAETCGHLAVLCALGNSEQVAVLHCRSVQIPHKHGPILGSLKLVINFDWDSLLANCWQFKYVVTFNSLVA